MEWKKILPALFILAILSVGYFFVGKTPSTPISISESQNQHVSEVGKTNTDSDNDGLKDWEEALWKTNAHSADTDGDGTTDGAEVEEGRNPTIIPPDTLTVQALEIRQKQNNTAVVSQKNEENPTKTASEDPLKTYGNGLAQALKDRDNQFKAKERLIFTKITGTSTLLSADFDAIATIAQSYTSLADAISNLEAPSKATVSKTALVSSYKKLAQELETLAGYKKSGSLPNDAFISYNDAAINVGEALIQSVTLFRNEGVIFSGNDAGVIFN